MRSGRLLHYEILERLGAGAMGEVFLAEDTRLGRRVVLKFLARHAAGGQLEREARALAALSHPHIARVFALETDGDTAFLVMEHVDGETLAEVLSLGALPAPEVAHIGESIAGALAHAHSRGVVHRDIKPENILVTEDGHVRLTDFGIATPRAGDGDEPVVLATGTPGYMSPEQSRGMPPDGRADLYSLGVVLIEALTGEPARPEKSPVETLARWRDATAAAGDPAVTPLLDELVGPLTRCVQTDPRRRPADAAGLHAELARLARRLDGRAPARSRHLAVLLVAAAVVGTIALAAIWILAPPPLADPDDVRTVVVEPFAVRGGRVSDLYVGQAFTRALRVGLEHASNLRMLPVASAAEADLRVSGRIDRSGGTNHALVSVIDARRHEVLWTVTRAADDAQVRFLARGIADEIADKVHAPRAERYDYYLYSLRSPALVNSPIASAALGALRRGDADGSLRWTAELVRRFPHEPEAHALRASRLLQEGWSVGPDAAQRRALTDELDRLRAVDPRNPWADTFESLMLFRDGRVEASEELFSRVLERQDLTPAARSFVLSRRGQSRRFLDETDAARADLEEATRLDPTNERTLAICAEALSAGGRAEEGLLRAQQAYALNPVSPLTTWCLAECLARLGRWTEALPYAEMACHDQPDAVNLALGALVLRQAGRRAEAEEQIGLAERAPRSDWSDVELARYHAVAGHPAKALALLRDAERRGYRDPEIQRLREFDPLRHDPAFVALLATMRRHWRGAPPAAVASAARP